MEENISLNGKIETYENKNRDSVLGNKGNLKNYK
jgi:hypothetical protein